MRRYGRFNDEYPKEYFVGGAQMGPQNQRRVSYVSIKVRSSLRALTYQLTLIVINVCIWPLAGHPRSVSRYYFCDLYSGVTTNVLSMTSPLYIQSARSKIYLLFTHRITRACSSQR